MKDNVKKLVLSAMFIAIGIVLPFFTGQVKQLGDILLPMHLPIFLCGLICSWKFGLAAGFILPLLRSLIFSMPPLYPNAIPMAFELATYGFIVGFIYEKAKKKNLIWLYISLIVAMLTGRLVAGSVKTIMLGMAGTPYSFNAFITASFIKAVPGIIIQLVIIPSLMLLIKKTKIKV